MSCFVTGGACSGTTIFNLYDYNGSHAELFSQSDYPYKVCCTGTDISNSCSGNYVNILNLSGATNSHVEKGTLSNYSNDVCLSASKNVTCGYAADCSTLGSQYVCMASISSDSNAHAGECGAYSTQVCCEVALLVSACTAKVASSPTVYVGNTNIQLCAGADVGNPADPCYSICWKGVGAPDLTSLNWKCGVCHDNSNNPVSCSTLSGTTYSWTLPSGYTSPADYTLISGTLTSANPIIKFTNASSSRILTLDVVSGNGPECSGQNVARLLPTWREIAPF